MPRVDIVRRNGKVVFERDSVEVLPGDTVFWRNLDPDAEHWITKQGEERTFWFRSPLARFVAGQQAAVTPGLSVSGTVRYECALHLGEGEQGEIPVG
jgi:plastocyanin